MAVCSKCGKKIFFGELCKDCFEKKYLTTTSLFLKSREEIKTVSSNYAKKFEKKVNELLKRRYRLITAGHHYQQEENGKKSSEIWYAIMIRMVTEEKEME